MFGGGYPGQTYGGGEPLKSSTSYSQILTEAITLTATALKTGIKNLSEALTLTASALKTEVRNLTQTLTLTATALKTNARNLSEALTLSDVLDALKGAVKELLETLNLLSTTTNIADSYSESNQDAGWSVDAVAAGNKAKVAQSFTANGNIINSAKFYLKKNGLPTGNAIAVIYAHSGTYGAADSNPTGAALATSDNLDVSTLTTSYQLITFTFSGANKISLTNGTHYFISFEYSGGDGSNYISVGRDGSSPSHAGSTSVTNNDAPTSWVNNFSIDTIFYIYTQPQDVLVRALTRPFSLTLSLTDTLSRSWVFERVKTEVLSLSDNLVKTPIKNLSEALSLSDIFSRTWIAIRNLTEALSISDTLVTIRTLIKELTEAITLSDTITKVTDYLRTLRETLNLTDILWWRHVKGAISWLINTATNGLFSKDSASSGGFTKDSPDNGSWTEENPEEGGFTR